MFDALTALNQLTLSKNGAGVLQTLIGAKVFTRNDEKQEVGFRFMQGAKNKANHISIRLMPDDTYTVKFIRIWGTNLKDVSEHTNQYWEDLKPLFERETSLYLSL